MRKAKIKGHHTFTSVADSRYGYLDQELDPLLRIRPRTVRKEADRYVTTFRSQVSATPSKNQKDTSAPRKVAHHLQRFSITQNGSIIRNH